MIQSNPPDPIDRIEQLLERFVDVTSQRVRDLTDNDQRLTQKMDRLVDAQLGTQAQIGLLSSSLLEMRERDNLYRVEQQRLWEEQQRLWEEQQRLWEENRQRHQESDQRFNILLEEIRAITRRIPEERS